MSRKQRDAVYQRLQTPPGRRFYRYPDVREDLDLGPLDALPGKWVTVTLGGT